MNTPDNADIARHAHAPGTATPSPRREARTGPARGAVARVVLGVIALTAVAVVLAAGHPSGGALGGAPADHRPGDTSAARAQVRMVRLSAVSTPLGGALPAGTPSIAVRPAVPRSAAVHPARALSQGSSRGSPRCPNYAGPVGYFDQTSNGQGGDVSGDGQSGLLVLRVGSIGVGLNPGPAAASRSHGGRAGHHASSRHTDSDDCGCVVNPDGWSYIPPPPHQGRPSGYNSNYPPAYNPSGYNPAPTYPYGYSNSYPNSGYPGYGAGYSVGGFPGAGYYPPGGSYNGAGRANPCAVVGGPGGYPVLDSSGRLLCRTATANNSNTAGVGLSLGGW